jgi:hypothetical protein
MLVLCPCDDKEKDCIKMCCFNINICYTKLYREGYDE